MFLLGILSQRNILSVDLKRFEQQFDRQRRKIELPDVFEFKFSLIAYVDISTGIGVNAFIYAQWLAESVVFIE